nr:unnamed protein product [Digitaria exilis]
MPFAGLAIILWPLAVIGAFLASIICSIPFGAYAAVIVYQESSFFFGLSYVLSSVSIFDEYTNDVLDMAPGSCFPRFKYRKDEASSHGGSLSRHTSFKGKHDGKKAPQRVTSFKSSFDEYNPFKALLRSAKANSDGLILSDGFEITSDNRPKSKIFEWFFDPLMVIKDQIKAENFTEEEEAYLEKQVLLISDPKRIKENLIRLPSLSEQKQAEIEAFARRLQGITKSMSRYPTAKRRFDVLVKSLSEELARTMGSQTANGSQVRKTKSGIVRMLSQRSVGKTTGIQGDDPEAQLTSDVYTE